jgi:hypothetical protein
MSAARMELAIWALLYGGLALAIVGLWSLEHGAAWPVALVAVGLVLAVVGVLLIWLRARLADAEPGKDDR